MTHLTVKLFIIMTTGT